MNGFMENVTIENKVERQVKIRHGVVLKSDLCASVQAPSIKVLRGDIASLCAAHEAAKLEYSRFEKKHHVSRDFAIRLITHIFGDCKIILTTD